MYNLLEHGLLGPHTAVSALQFPGLDVALVVVSVEEVVTVAPVPFEVVVPVVVPVVVISVVVVLRYLRENR